MDELLSIHPKLLESGVFWCSQVLGLCLLPLAFSLILTVASRLLHRYSTDDKTSRLMVERFSTVSSTRRGSQSYIEKREEGDRGDQEERWWGQKERDRSIQ